MAVASPADSQTVSGVTTAASTGVSGDQSQVSRSAESSAAVPKPAPPLRPILTKPITTDGAGLKNRTSSTSPRRQNGQGDAQEDKDL